MEDLEHKLYSLQDADALSHARCPFLSSLSPSGRPAPAPRNAVRLDAPPLAAYGVEGARGEGPLERERESSPRYVGNGIGVALASSPMSEREERAEACRAGRGRGRLVWRAGFVGASRASAGRPGGRASRVGMGTVSLSRFQMQMWRGGARGRRGGRQGGERATARSVAKDGWGDRLRRWRKGDKTTTTRVGFKCD